MRPVHIFMNMRSSGGRAARFVPIVKRWVDEHAPSSSFSTTESIEQATRLIKRLPSHSRIIIAGGDGTVSAALPSICSQKHELGVLALGSGNDAARAFRTYGLETTVALAQLLSNDSSLVDLGEVQFGRATHLFASSLTAGFDAAVALRAQNGPQWLSGLPRYLLATFRELIDLRHWNVCIAIDKTIVYEGDALFASSLNTPTFGSGMPAVPFASIDDRQLDLLLAQRFTRRGALTMLPRLLKGTHLRDVRVSCYPFAHMRVSSSTPMPLAADGELLGEVSEFEVRVLPQALRVVKAQDPAGR